MIKFEDLEPGDFVRDSDGDEYEVVTILRAHRVINNSEVLGEPIFFLRNAGSLATSSYSLSEMNNEFIVAGAQVEVTLEEVAKLKGISVERLRIKE